VLHQLLVRFFDLLDLFGHGWLEAVCVTLSLRCLIIVFGVKARGARNAAFLVSTPGPLAHNLWLYLV
jgi:hypothetical protein